MKRYVIYGEYLTPKEISEKYGIPTYLLYQRIARGYPPEQAILAEPMKPNVKEWMDNWMGWRNYVGYTTDEVYNDYWRWYQKYWHKTDDSIMESKIGLMRMICKRYPELKIVSNKGTKYFRER